MGRQPREAVVDARQVGRVSTRHPASGSHPPFAGGCVSEGHLKPRFRCRSVRLGNAQCRLDAIIGKPYGSVFTVADDGRTLQQILR